MNRALSWGTIAGAGLAAGMVAVALAQSPSSPAPATDGLTAGGAPAAQPAGAPRKPYHPAYLDLPPPTTPVPSWAYTMDPPESADLKRRDDDDVPKHVPGSKVVGSRTKAMMRYDNIDWYPDEHPPAPHIVMFGRTKLSGCAFCHTAEGVGMPENAPLAGLPVNYFIRQVKDFQAGKRKTVDMRMASWHGMAEVISPLITDEDLKEAAEYYSKLKLAPYLTVVETDMVPKVHSQQYTLMPVPEGGKEPIGNRVIETPKNIERFHLMDAKVGYFVYVPKGSIAKGKVLVTTGGNGRTLACVSCHGADLKGVGDIPPIAGRSPSNLARQLYNIKFGARATDHSELMKPVVEKLTDEDIVNITAYVASRKP